MAQALFLGVKQHCLLGWYSLNYQRMDQVTLELWRRRQRLPDDDVEALVTTARAIQAIFEARNTCDFMAGICRGMVEVMEAIRNRAPKAANWTLRAE